MNNSIIKHTCLYFLLAYAFTWLFWVPREMASQGYLQLPADPVVFHLAGAFGPAVAAMCLTFAVGGKAGLQKLLAPYRRLNVCWKWYAFVVLARPLIWSAALLVYFLLGRQKAVPNNTDLVFFVLYLVSQLLVVGVGEELGWAGYALPRLQVRLGFIKANLILGFLWGLWHLPFFFTLWDSQYGASIFVFTLKLTAFRFLFSAVYNRTRSLVMPGLFHVSFNALTEQIPLSPNDPLAIGLSLVFVVAYLLIGKRKGWAGTDPSTPERMASVLPT